MEEQNTTSRKFKVYLAILALLLLVVIFWLFIQRSQLLKLVNEKEVEKTEMQHELDSLMGEHNKIKSSYGALSDSLSAKDSIIQRNAEEIKNCSIPNGNTIRSGRNSLCFRRSPRAMCTRWIRCIP